MVSEAWMMPVIVVSQSFSPVVVDVVLADSEACLTVAVVVLLASFLSCTGRVTLFA